MAERMISALGVVTIMGIAFLFCPPALRQKINWRTIGLGMLLLIGFAILVLHTPVKYAFKFANDFVDKLLSFSSEGAKFVFNALGVPTPPVGFVFATQILPTIIFFAAFMAVLCHLGVMPFGGYSGLCPERRSDLSRLGLRAMIGGTLATCMVAGMLLG